MKKSNYILIVLFTAIIMDMYYQEVDKIDEFDCLKYIILLCTCIILDAIEKKQ